MEVVIALGLILGAGTRYAALLCALFLIVATALAHRYWEYPAAQVLNQYNHFLKNLALLGGALILFVTGRGPLERRSDAVEAELTNIGDSRRRGGQISPPCRLGRRSCVRFNLPGLPLSGSVTAARSRS